jgi:molybdopterin converting factor small subunit
VGKRRLELPYEEGDTVESIRDRLVAAYPVVAGFVPSLLYALNEEYAQANDPVSPGATLALIPPVSGG